MMSRTTKGALLRSAAEPANTPLVEQARRSFPELTAPYGACVFPPLQSVALRKPFRKNSAHRPGRLARASCIATLRARHQRLTTRSKRAVSSFKKPQAAAKHKRSPGARQLCFVSAVFIEPEVCAEPAVCPPATPPAGHASYGPLR